MNTSRFLTLAGLAAAMLSASAADPWPSFRGPNASGVSPTAKPPARFGPEEAVVWKTEVPWSPSSPSVWGDRLFLTTFRDGKLETRCHSTADGRLLWFRVLSAEKLEEYHLTEGSPAASTPATDGQKVVTYFGSAGLACYDLEGKELWHHPLPPALTGGNFGSGTSPLIAGGLVLLNRDQTRNSTLLAVRLEDGKKVWEVPRPDAPTSYGTPVLSQQGGVAEVILAGSLQMRGYDLKTGAENWRVRGLPSYACTTPVLGDGLIFFAGWSPGKADSPFPKWESVVEKQDKNGDGWVSPEEFTDGIEWFKAQDLDGDGKLEREDWDDILSQMKLGENALLAVKQGGRGDITGTHVAWRFERGLPYVPSPLYYQGRVYIVKDGGMISSFDAATGKPFYTQERLKARGSYYASPVAADGKIILASLDGKVTVVKAGGETPEILHEADFGERIAGTPALVGPRLYLRAKTRLYAFEAPRSTAALAE